MKVYIVIEYYYEDEDIKGVFDSKEKAIAYRDELRKEHDWTEIVPCELNKKDGVSPIC